MGGKLRFSVLMLWFIIVEIARVGATVWLSYWTDSVDTPGGAPHGPLWYLMIYTIISGIQVGLHKPLILNLALKWTCTKRLKDHLCAERAVVLSH